MEEVSGRQCCPLQAELLVWPAAARFVRNLIGACGSWAEESDLHGLLLLFRVNNSDDTGLVSFCQVLLWVIVDVLVTTNNSFSIMIYSLLPTEQKFIWGPSCIATDASFCRPRHFSGMVLPAEKDCMLITLLHFDGFRQLRTSVSLIPNIYYTKHPLFRSKIPCTVSIAARRSLNCISVQPKASSQSVHGIPGFCF